MPCTIGFFRGGSIELRGESLANPGCLCRSSVSFRRSRPSVGLQRETKCTWAGVLLSHSAKYAQHPPLQSPLSPPTPTPPHPPHPPPNPLKLPHLSHPPTLPLQPAPPLCPPPLRKPRQILPLKPRIEMSCHGIRELMRFSRWDIMYSIWASISHCFSRGCSWWRSGWEGSAE